MSLQGALKACLYEILERPQFRLFWLASINPNPIQNISDCPAISVLRLTRIAGFFCFVPDDLGCEGDVMKTAPWILAIAVCLAVSSSSAVAAPSGGLRMTVDDPGAALDGSRPRDVFGAVAVVHSFTGNEMKDAYGQMFGAYARGGQQFASGAGWRVEGGLMIAVGDPLFPDSTWEVDLDSTSMEMMVVPLGASFVYEFSGSGSERRLMPYIGLGLDGYFGFERTSVKISRFPEGKFDWNDTRYRYAWAGHVLLGTTIGLTEKVRGLVEIRWTQGLDGSDVEQSFSEEEINEGWGKVAEAVQRPDFNFTGWSVSVGARW
jgi:hypothetical protein